MAQIRGEGGSASSKPECGHANVPLKNDDQSKQKKKHAASRTIRSGRIVCPSLVYESWSEEARPLYERFNSACPSASEESSERFANRQKEIPPSSTEISTFPSGLAAQRNCGDILPVFVNGLLLREIESGQRETNESEPRKTDALDKIENRNSIPYWAVQWITIMSE